MKRIKKSLKQTLNLTRNKMVESFTPSAQVYNVAIQDNVCKMKKKNPHQKALHESLFM